jgi:hypothetical protein
MATSHDIARYGRHRADNNCLAWGKDSATQIKLFYEFESEMSSMVVLWVEGSCYDIKGGSPQLGATAMTRSQYD